MPLQVSAFSTPFAQPPHSGTEADAVEGQGQDQAQPLLRSPSQVSSAAPSISDMPLSAIPELEQAKEGADAEGLPAIQEAAQQVQNSHHAPT